MVEATRTKPSEKEDFAHLKDTCPEPDDWGDGYENVTICLQFQHLSGKHGVGNHEGFNTSEEWIIE